MLNWTVQLTEYLHPCAVEGIKTQIYCSEPGRPSELSGYP